MKIGPLLVLVSIASITSGATALMNRSSAVGQTSIHPRVYDVQDWVEDNYPNLGYQTYIESHNSQDQSDHARGLAIDFVFDNPQDLNTVTSAIAEEMCDLDIKYVVSDGRIFNVQRDNIGDTNPDDWRTVRSVGNTLLHVSVLASGEDAGFCN